MRRRPDGLREVADVEAPRLERALLEHGERRHPGGECARPPARAAPAAGSRRCDRALEQRPPARAEHGLARLRLVRRAAGRADAVGEAGVGGEAPDGGGERLRIAGRDEERVATVGEQLARGRGVGGDERACRRRSSGMPCSGSRGPPWRRCRRCRARSPRTGSRPAGPRTRPRGPTPRSAGGRSRSASSCPLPTTRNGISGASARRGEDRLEAVERDQLADEERVKRRLGLPPGRRRAGPRRRRSRPRPRSAREAELLAEERGVRLGVGDDDIGAAKRSPVDEVDDAGAGRAAPEAAAVVDERVEEGHERIEDDGPPARDALGGRQVEVPGIADDQRVRVALGRPASGAGSARPRRRAASAAARPTSCGGAPRRRGAARAPRRPRRAAPR